MILNSARRLPRYVQDITAQLETISWPVIEGVTGITASAYKEAMQSFAKGQKVVILVGPGVLRTSGGFGMMVNLLDLLLLTGKLTTRGCGLAPLAEENNDQGTFEMGGVGDVLPGGKSSRDEEARKALSQAWGRPVPDSAGASLHQMIEAAKNGQLKALFIVGENPLGSLPPSSGIEQALEKLEFLVSQDLFMTETAKKAHVVLPACSYAEKDGTFTNTEGHLQPVRRAIEPVGESRPDWEVFSALSVLMGDAMEYAEVKEIGKEIHSLLPGTRTLGPTPLPAKPDPSAVSRYVSSEYKRDLASRYRVPSSVPSSPEQMSLMISQSLFHSGKFSLKAKGLMQIQSEGKLYLHPEEAARRGLGEGDRVKVMNNLGEMSTIVSLRERIPHGMAMFPEHFDQELRRLLPYAVDPETHVPYYKLTSVRIEKVTAS